MTIETTISTKSYTGNGVTTTFNFPYLFYADTDLEVYVDSVLQTSGYSITGAGDISGGNVIFTTAPASSTSIVISRVVDYTQETDFENFDGNPADVTEKQFDLVVMQLQQINTLVDRSAKIPVSEGGSYTVTLPAPVDGSLLAWNGVTGALDNVALGDISTSIDAIFTSPVSGDYISYNGTNWVNKSTFTNIKADGASGIVIKNSSGTTVATLGASATTASTFVGNTTVQGLLAVQGITYTTGRIEVAGNSTEAGYIKLFEDTDNGTNSVSIKPPQSISSDYTVTLPSSSGTLLIDYNSPFLHLQDQKASGTAGGTFTSGAWQTRTLNTEVTDTIGSTLSSNQFTLPSGTYYIEAFAPVVNVNFHQARLQNITDSSTPLLGTNNYAGTNTGGLSTVCGLVTISATKTFELQNRCSLTRATDGFGVATSWGTEVYAEVRAWKVA